MSRDQPPVYGVLGVGAIAEAIVTGLCADEASAPAIVLSPRGQRRSAELAARLPSVRVADDNQEVVDAAEVVLVCVRPPQAGEVLRPLSWRSGQAVVSMLAGVPVAALAQSVDPVTEIARAIPLPAVARRGSPTPIHPPTESARRLFDSLGGALAIPEVDAFDAMSATTATFASHLRFLATVSGWLAAHGVEEEAAARYVASMYAGLGRSLETPSLDLDGLAAEYATPGGLNERFAAMLDEAGAFAEVERSLERILDDLRSG